MKAVGLLMLVSGGLLVWWANHYAAGHTTGSTTSGQK